MPCEVSLLELVRIAGTRPLWPDEFRSIIDKIEADPMDRTNYGVLADWLKDGERGASGEEWLERACRFIAKRPEIEIDKSTTYSSPYWHIKKLPSPFKYGLESSDKGDNSTVAGVLAHLAVSIKKQIEELE